MVSPSQSTPVARAGGKGGKSKGGKKGSGNLSKSARAELTFPVGRTARLMREGNYAHRTGVGAAVFLTAILEYLTIELLDLAGTVTLDMNRQRVVPRHLALAIRGDDELSRLLNNVTIASGGVPSSVNEALLPKKSGKKSAAEE